MLWRLLVNRWQTNSFTLLSFSSSSLLSSLCEDSSTVTLGQVTPLKRPWPSICPCFQLDTNQSLIYDFLFSVMHSYIPCPPYHQIAWRQPFPCPCHTSTHSHLLLCSHLLHQALPVPLVLYHQQLATYKYSTQVLGEVCSLLSKGSQSSMQSIQTSHQWEVLHLLSLQIYPTAQQIPLTCQLFGSCHRK